MKFYVNQLLQKATNFQYSWKGTVSRDFRPFFLKRFDLGKICLGENGLVNFFVFAKIFPKNVCPRSRWLRGHFWKTLKASHRFKRSNQAKKIFRCVFISNCNNLKYENLVDYADTRFSNFAIEYRRKIETFSETLFAYSYGAQVEPFQPKNSRKYRDTVPLNEHQFCSTTNGPLWFYICVCYDTAWL